MGAPDDVLLSSLRRAQRLMDGGANGAGLASMLKDADADLKKRLSKVALAQGSQLRFTEAQAMAYQRQTQVVLEYVQGRLLGYTHDASLAACQTSVKAAVTDLAALDKAYTGVAVPLRLREAGQLAGVVDKAFKPLLAQHATSVDRYGTAMIGEVRQILRRGIMAGASNSQMVHALAGHGGPKGTVSLAARVDPVTGKVVRLKEADIPEGLFARKKYWAQRIVRTEIAHAQNEGSLRAIEEETHDFPDLGKKILAVLDKRTANDSLYVHGQVRKVADLFMDGAGRQYLRPPARPNDRETIVPWRMAWSETAYSAPVPPEQVAQAQLAHKPAGEERRLMVEQLTEQARAEQKKNEPALLASVETLLASKLASTSAALAEASAATTSAAAIAKAKSEAAAGLAAAKEIEALEAISIEQKAQASVTAAGQAQAKAVASAAEKVAAAKVKAAKYQAELKAKAIQKKEFLLEDSSKVQQLLALGKTEGGTAVATSILKSMLKSEPQVFAALYDKVVKGWGGLSPKFMDNASTGSISGLVKKLGFPAPAKAAPPKPPAAEPAKPALPFVQPDPAFSLEGYEHKLSSKWLDIHKGNNKLAYIVQEAEAYKVTPPDWLQAEGWPAMSWAQDKAHLPAATHYALQVSSKIQANATKVAAAKKVEQEAAQALAKVEAEKREALRAAKFKYSERWREPTRPAVTRSPAEELEARWSDLRAGVGVASDGGFVEGHSITVQRVVDPDGSEWLVGRFKLPKAAEKAATDAMKLGGAMQEEARFKQGELGSDELKLSKGSGKSLHGVTELKRALKAGGEVRVAQGGERHALHNAVTVRVPMPTKGKRFDAISKAVKEAFGADVSAAPAAPQQELARRALLIQRFGNKSHREAIGGEGHPADRGDPQVLFANRVAGTWEKMLARLSPRELELCQAADRDARLHEVSPGHVTYFSPSLAAAARKANRVVFASLTADSTDVLEQMFARGGGSDHFGAMLSSRERFSRGNFTQGMSTSRDFETGGADAVFTRLRKGPLDGGSGRVEIDGSELGRLDYWAYNDDKYGDAHGWGSRRSMDDVIDGGQDGAGNEVMFKHSIGMQSVRRVWVGRLQRKQLLATLKERGVSELNGMPVEELFVED